MDNTSAQYPTYWEVKEENLILKRLSDTLVNQVQVKGQELTNDFHHNWEKVTFPSKERLDRHLQDSGFIETTLDAYDQLLTQYFEINERKRTLFTQNKQKRTLQP